MGGIALSPDGSTSADIKRAWSYIKLLHSESMGIPALSWNNRKCANDVSKAEALREQYESVFTREDLNNIPVLPESLYQDFPDITFFAHGIQKLLESIRSDKTCGPDQIPARILKESASQLALILASLFQHSFEDGTIPSAWKDANITTIFKKGHSADPRNYRSTCVIIISYCKEHGTHYF